MHAPLRKARVASVAASSALLPIYVSKDAKAERRTARSFADAANRLLPGSSGRPAEAANRLEPNASRSCSSQKCAVRREAHQRDSDTKQQGPFFYSTSLNAEYERLTVIVRSGMVTSLKVSSSS